MIPETPPETVRTLAEVRAAAARFRDAGESVALVPTMGALHEGHLALVRLAQERRCRTIVSIFVNPRQFGPGEDFARYPRDEAGDLARLAGVGCDAAWLPDAAAMYPEGFATRIEMGGPAEGLESAFRPGHFAGVALVCLKLFAAVLPAIAVFGEKDYQQLCVIRQMVRDLNLPVGIVAAPTVREADGLALSSRNRYLSPEERAIAPALYAALQRVAEAVRSGGDGGAAARTEAEGLLAKGFAAVDYLEVRDAAALSPYEPRRKRPARVLAAAWLGATRLIDNVAV